MKICFLICGLTRTIDLVISNIESKFIDHEIVINVCTSYSDELDDEYLNFGSNDIIKNKNIKNLLFIQNETNDSFRNSCNFYKKIKSGITLLESGFDLYIILRSDCLFNNNSFIDNVKLGNLYFSNEDINTFTKNEVNKINEHVMASKQLEDFKIISEIYDYCINNTDYSDIILHEYLNKNEINYEKIDIQYKLVLSKCNVFAISGDSGSGKTTMMKVLKNVFCNDKLLTLETDRYHKWERGNTNYNEYTHLNPYANRLELMACDVYNLKLGDSIFQVDYDHETGKFTEKQKIESKENIILCGLHTIYNAELNRSIDLKIFMDTDRDLLKKWKIQRDVNERGYTLEKVLNQIENREKDYIKYIKNQKNNADILINFYENSDEELNCNLRVNDSKKFNKMKKDLLFFNYKLNMASNSICLQNDLLTSDNFLKDIQINFENDRTVRFYKNILFLLKIYLQNS